ncbi:hypothetical protein HQN59_13245 [Schlegelella sp. ID0723]|uniref:Uncharacterized protein n=1 Tax=Piscinibacter koreensis TaxID=2742824 RepID=A0A7Y6NP12_9BURK|nr:hypothetical protein [Schlegelella koreensis]
MGPERSRRDLRDPRWLALSYLRWVSFAWSSLACGTLAYFVVRWLTEPLNPMRDELLEGASIGGLVGAPAWLALFLSVGAAWRQFGPAKRTVLLAPVIASAALLLAVAVGGGL